MRTRRTLKVYRKPFLQFTVALLFSGTAWQARAAVEKPPVVMAPLAPVNIARADHTIGSGSPIALHLRPLPVPLVGAVPLFSIPVANR